MEPTHIKRVKVFKVEQWNTDVFFYPNNPAWNLQKVMQKQANEKNKLSMN